MGLFFFLYGDTIPGFYMSVSGLGSQHEPLLERAAVVWGKKMALYLDSRFEAREDIPPSSLFVI